MSSEQQRQRRAGWRVSGLVFAAMAVLAVAGVITAHYVTTTAQPAHGIRPAPAGSPGPSPGERGGGAGAVERALVVRPMLRLPEAAALPHTLTSETAGPPLVLPRARATAGRLVPGGFPATAQGAVAQLVALSEAGLVGGDPDAYARAYRAVSVPGAPPVEATGWMAALRGFRAHAELPPTGATTGVSVTFTPTSGLIKGTAEGGRFAVVCVLGQFSVQHQGQTLTAGIGDCQAMRWTRVGWRIAPGALASAAPCAWPGTDEAVRAGYRELR